MSPVPFYAMPVAQARASRDPLDLAGLLGFVTVWAATYWFLGPVAALILALVYVAVLMVVSGECRRVGKSGGRTAYHRDDLFNHLRRPDQTQEQANVF
jgi:hypothetical protein